MKLLKYFFAILFVATVFSCSEEPILKGDGDEDDDPVLTPPPPPGGGGRSVVHIDSLKFDLRN